MLQAGKVIVLNGTSSSGKTTLAKAFQSISSQQYLHCSLDAFRNLTPPIIAANSTNFPKLKLAMAKSIKALAETGHNVIVDTVLLGKTNGQQLKTELEGLECVFVKVECSSDQLNKREQARGNRRIGLAESQFIIIHERVAYDFEINTYKSTSLECAHELLAMLS